MAEIIQQALLNRVKVQRRRQVEDAMDARVRQALRTAEEKGKLDVVSAVTGLNVESLQKIMSSKEPISLIDRSLLGVHLG